MDHGRRIDAPAEVHVALVSEGGREFAYVHGARIDVTGAQVAITRQVGPEMIVLTVHIQEQTSDRVLLIALDRHTGQAIDL